GRQGVDDGIVVIVAKSDRTMRLEVGYGLEGAVPDATAKRLIEDYFLPRFRAGDFYGGLNDGLQRLMKIVAGEPLPAARRDSTDGQSLQTIFALFLFLIFAGGGLLRAMLGRFVGATAVGGVAGVAAWLIAGSALIAALIAIAGFVLTLFGGVGTGMGGWQGGTYRGGWGGGGFGGGGFRGGGGGFGGGGASGRW
ncbi:MAG: TPM domain-containing protein, partial [Burkholderiales bacterium]